MTADLLTPRQLNRATLHRQHLLGRVRRPALDVVRQLVGLQAQNPRDPYVALWSRLVDFDPTELEELLLGRQVVRLVVQRGTVHVVTADDCLVLRPLAQPILVQQLHAHQSYKHSFEGVDLDDVMDGARQILDQPRNARQLREALAEQFPDLDAGAMAFACRNLLAFVQVPPRGLWNKSGAVIGTTAEAWLGRPLDESPSVDAVMLRYVAAFGPATIRDAATWSRYTGLREVFERLRPQLRTFHDDAGRELFDVPDSVVPDPDTPAPPRFLPEYDNVLLAHADRRRIVGDEFRARMPYDRLGFLGNLLVDGMLVGGWRLDGRAMLTVYTVDPLDVRARHDVEAEAHRLLHLLAPDGRHEVRFEIVG